MVSKAMLAIVGPKAALLTAVTGMLLLTHCGQNSNTTGQLQDTSSATDQSVTADVDYAKPGPFAIGVVQLLAEDPARKRSLHFSLWYPATGSGQV